MKTHPRIPIAAPQCGDEPQTWANKTILTRFPNTAQKLLDENDFSPQIQERILALSTDIHHGQIRPIDNPGAPDFSVWQEYVEPYLGQSWFQPPWFFTEHYFYRRILEAIRYFQHDNGDRPDPFIYQKELGLKVSRPAIRDLMDRVSVSLQTANTDSATMANLLYLDLWGNQADLSLWPAEGENKPDHTDLSAARAHILVDDAPGVAEFLTANSGTRIDFLIDNAGFELVSDLALAFYLLKTGLADVVRFHVKVHPTFVSDAMIKDVLATLQFLQADEHPAVKAVGTELTKFYSAHQFQIRENWIWNSPLDGWQLPSELYSELATASLVISKGDANYRRLLGDRHWSYTTNFSDILSYFPAPLVALRTLKSELIAGLKLDQAAQVAAQDPDWLINGRWGLVQAHFPPN
jgi:uncharacterized protein with ATP-grasp and redox domains